jgi:hypothetical protein
MSNHQLLQVYRSSTPVATEIIHKPPILELSLVVDINSCSQGEQDTDIRLETDSKEKPLWSVAILALQTISTKSCMELAEEDACPGESQAFRE